MEAVFIPAPTTGNMFGNHLNQKELIVEIMGFINTRLVARSVKSRIDLAWLILEASLVLIHKLVACADKVVHLPL